MTARSTRGTQIYMTTAAATPTEITPTTISAAAPAVVTVGDVSDLETGMLITFESGATGMAGLDGQNFAIGEIDTELNTFEVVGSDTTGQTYSAGTGLIETYDTSDMVLLCLASLTRNAGTPETTSVGTYCDPTATISSATVEAGTFDFTGYVDVSQPDFQELVKAFEDGDERTFEVILPGDNGYIIFTGVVSSFDYDLPIDGAIGYSGTITLSGRPVHRF